jgi:hypothetical protein
MLHIFMSDDRDFLTQGELEKSLKNITFYETNIISSNLSLSFPLSCADMRLKKKKKKKKKVKQEKLLWMLCLDLDHRSAHWLYI